MNTEYNWNTLQKIGGIAAFLIVVNIPFQIAIFAVWPPPETTIGFFELFKVNSFLGLLSLDLLYYFSNALLAVFYLGLFAVLRRYNFAAMLISLSLGFIGIASYFASTIGFEMLLLSKQYFMAESLEVQQQFLAAGHVLLARYKGTAFDIYYILNAIALLIISITMLKSKIFGKAAAAWGLASGILMTIPSTAGTIGLIFSIASLIPWIVFSILVGRKLINKV